MLMTCYLSFAILGLRNFTRSSESGTNIQKENLVSNIEFTLKIKCIYGLAYSSLLEIGLVFIKKLKYTLALSV